MRSRRVALQRPPRPPVRARMGPQPDRFSNHAVVERRSVRVAHQHASTGDYIRFYPRLHRRERNTVVAGSSGSSSAGRAITGDSLRTLWKFSRPHTMLGTFISVVSVSLLAIGQYSVVLQSELSTMAPFVVATVVSALVPALLMNVSIVGLNQIYDIEIDRTNKPYLPIPSGELAVGDAWRIVGATAGASLALGAAASSLPLMCTLVGSLLLGVAYSVDAPMLRWKRYPTLAAMCILSVRAVLVQFGFFFHARQALAGSVGMAGMESMTSVTRMTSMTSMATSNQAFYFATAFMFIFSIVIALFKDIPDVRGDKLNKMNTFTVRLGARRVFWTCIGLLQAAYASSIVYSLVYLKGWTCAGSVVAHGAVALLILRRALRTDLESASNIYGCYMDIWKAFYFEYLLIPLFAAAV